MSQFSLGSLFGFGQAAAAAPAATAPAAQPTPGAPGAPAPTANGNQPTTGAPAEATTQVPPTAVDLFAALVQNNGAGAETPTAPRFTIPAETLQAAAGQMDFLQGANVQEAIAKIQAGDFSGMLDLIQHSSRAGYQHALTHNMALTERFVGDRIGFELPAIDKRIAQGLATSDLQSIESLHPVAQGMFKDTVTKLQAAYPQANRAQLEAQAWTMMEDLGKQFDRTGRQKQQQADAAAPNWDAYGGFTQDQ